MLHGEMEVGMKLPGTTQWPVYGAPLNGPYAEIALRRETDGGSQRDDERGQQNVPEVTLHGL